MTADRFAAGVASIEAGIAADVANPAIDPRCTPILLHHGRAAERAIVIYHGFTNCPRQFAQFGELLFQCGFNVYVPRLPRHGLRDKLTPCLADLTIDELTQSALTATARSRSLGANVTALGLSVGATMAAWLAQTQILERAICIAPFFSVAHVPSLVEPVLAGALALAPDVQMWWDPRNRENVGPAHAYPRFPTHALARCMQLGERVRELARAGAPQTARSTLVLNAKDPAIDNAAARDVWALWRERAAPVDEYIFDDLDARHDIIEPETYADAASLVYPVLLKIVQA